MTYSNHHLVGLCILFTFTHHDNGVCQLVSGDYAPVKTLHIRNIKFNFCPFVLHTGPLITGTV